jgi:hypothetical protein
LGSSLAAPAHHTQVSASRYCIFDSLHETGPDDLSGWLCLNHHRLLCKRIDTFVRLCGWLFDNNELCKSAYKKSPGVL